MKVLVVLLLAVLGCSLQAEGRTVAKCDLRDQLTAALGNLTWVGRNGVHSSEQLVAKFVCLADKSAGFSTTAKKELPPGQIDHEHQGEGQPHSYENRQNQNETLNAPPPQAWVLYGIFQLSNRLSCNDSVNSTYNVCDKPCNNFLDDDITDDIDCLLTFFKNLASNGSPPPPIKELLKRLHLIFKIECQNINPTEYFIGCPPPPN